jgi:hypothetical protein
MDEINPIIELLAQSLVLILQASDPKLQVLNLFFVVLLNISIGLKMFL